MNPRAGSKPDAKRLAPGPSWSPTRGPGSPRAPDVAAAMRQIIEQARARLPAAASPVRVCTGDCATCAIRLLDTFEAELDDWERRLDVGERPGLADLSALARLGREVLAEAGPR